MHLTSSKFHSTFTKNLATYLGSYTELKHDTLLYTKQAYAEMWAGGNSDCDLYVYPPILPVPKGYIEADTAFLDRLIALNDAMKNWFTDKDNFEGFGHYLQKLEPWVKNRWKIRRFPMMILNDLELHIVSFLTLLSQENSFESLLVRKRDLPWLLIYSHQKMETLFIKLLEDRCLWQWWSMISMVRE